MSRHLNFKAVWPRTEHKAQRRLDDPALGGLAPAIRQILLRDWDPLRVQDSPYVQTEYDAFVVPVCLWINACASVDELTEALENLEADHYGIRVDAGKRRRTAAKLAALRFDIGCP